MSRCLVMEAWVYQNEMAHGRWKRATLTRMFTEKRRVFPQPAEKPFPIRREMCYNKARNRLRRAEEYTV